MTTNVPMPKKRVSPSSMTLCEEKVFTWVIEDFGEAVNLNKKNDFTDLDLSVVFEAGKSIGFPTKWKVYLQKNGDAFGICLQLLESPQDAPQVYATFTYDMIDMIVETPMLRPLYMNNDDAASAPSQMDFKRIDCFGKPAIICLKHFCDILIEVRKPLTIKVKFSVSKVHTSTSSLTHLKRAKLDCESAIAIGQDFQSLLDSGENADIILEMPDGQTLRAHMVVLTARSPVFAAMFRNQMEESASRIVRIDDLSTETMKIILKFIYAGTLEEKWEEGIEKILYAAEKYELLLLKKHCDVSLASTCRPENAWHLLELAQRHELKMAEGQIDQYIKAHIEDIIQAKKAALARQR